MSPSWPSQPCRRQIGLPKGRVLSHEWTTINIANLSSSNIQFSIWSEERTIRISWCMVWASKHTNLCGKSEVWSLWHMNLCGIQVWNMICVRVSVTYEPMWHVRAEAENRVCILLRTDSWHLVDIFIDWYVAACDQSYGQIYDQSCEQT